MRLEPHGGGRKKEVIIHVFSRFNAPVIFIGLKSYPERFRDFILSGSRSCATSPIEGRKIRPREKKHVSRKKGVAAWAARRTRDEEVPI